MMNPFAVMILFSLVLLITLVHDTKAFQSITSVRTTLSSSSSASLIYRQQQNSVRTGCRHIVVAAAQAGNDDDDNRRLMQFRQQWQEDSMLPQKKYNTDPVNNKQPTKAAETSLSSSLAALLATVSTAAATALVTLPERVSAAVTADVTTTSSSNKIFQGLSMGSMDPSNFSPVCATSDGIYRLLQQSTVALVGKENFVEYGPLIAGGLLRVRLELCVVESFFNEAVGPFIAQNGLSWILPIHETVETFLAGGIFALATTFILIGSTKIVTVLMTYTDFLFGLPARLFGGFTFDRAQGKPVTLDIGLGPWFRTRLIGPPNTKPGENPEMEFNIMDRSILDLIVLVLSGIVKLFGETLGLIRSVLEKIDFFVGRYLVLWASFYLLLKFLHFKVFPDFP